MIEIPKYYVRPDDNEIFSINESGLYSVHKQKLDFPNSLHAEYKGEYLESLGFRPSKEKVVKSEQIIERLKKILAEDTEDNTYNGYCPMDGCDDYGDLLDEWVNFREKLIDLIDEFESKDKTGP